MKRSAKKVFLAEKRAGAKALRHSMTGTVQGAGQLEWTERAGQTRKEAVEGSVRTSTLNEIGSHRRVCRAAAELACLF